MTTYVAWFTLSTGGYALYKAGDTNQQALVAQMKNWMESDEQSITIVTSRTDDLFNYEIVSRSHVVKVVIKEDNR